MKTKILPGIQAIQDEMIALRHQIHSQPEIGFEEFLTSDLVAKYLTKWGYKVTRGLGGTGVVGQLVTREGPRLGLRAEMDALPILETTGLPYSSTHHGKMHACGHDGHTASLLAAAKYLSEHRDFCGTLNLIFQPAEEGFGGAKKMIDHGLFEQFPCDAVFAFHNMPGYPTGKFGFMPGPMMASSDTVTIHIQGKGGHGAMPHLSIDPIVVAASIVMSLQSIVARNVDPLSSAVISIGSIQAGETNNVIPDDAVIKLSIRALDGKVQDKVEQRIKEIATLQAQSFGATAKIDYQRTYPILSNNVQMTHFAQQVAINLFGEEVLIPHLPQIMASEDFSFMLNICPGSYLFIGNGVEGTHGCSVHNPEYDFNDEILPIAASYWAILTQQFLVKNSA